MKSRLISPRSRPVLTAVIGLASVSALTMPAVWAQETPPAPAAPAAAPAAPPAAPKIDPEARAIVDQMVKAHQILTSYSATMNFAIQAPGMDKTQAAKIAYQKPNKARVTTNNPTNNAAVNAVSNGTNLYLTVSTEKDGYHKGAAAPDAKAIAQVISMSKATGIGLFPMLATDPKIAQAILPPGLTALTHGPDETVDNAPCDVVSASFGPSPDKQITIAFVVGKTDHLLRKLTLVQPSPEAGKNVTLTETYSDVQVNPALPAPTFAFTPAPGMKEIKDAAPAEDAPFDARLKKGAMPLPFKGNDLAGKPVSLAAYKGKVVLLDFWATWCPPCREEVPNLVKTYNKYHAKGLEVVGVSLDREGDKPKLVSYTKDNGMTWRQVYDGKYWQAAMAKAYGVQSIPFSVLIGRDGKILAVGDSLRGEDLEPAIKAAVAAK